MARQTPMMLLFLAAWLVTTSASPTLRAVEPRGAQPLYPYDPKTVSPCALWLDYDADDNPSCDIILLSYGITVQELVQWNPSLTISGSSCGNLQVNESYCVEIPVASSNTAPVSTTTATPTTTTVQQQPTTTTTSGNGVITPTPTQPGISSNCDQFYFVQKGDTCNAVAQQYGLSAADIESMNPGVGSDCEGMQAGVYLCIALIGQPDRVASSVQTPSPIQPGMVTDCDEFVWVNKGDTCAGIASANGITPAEFEQWNSGVGSDCLGMWAQAYACVGVSS